LEILVQQGLIDGAEAYTYKYGASDPSWVI